MITLDISKIGENMDLLFFTCYNLYYLKEIMVNIKLGYYKAVADLQKLTVDIRSFLETLELMEDDDLQMFK